MRTNKVRFLLLENLAVVVLELLELPLYFESNVLYKLSMQQATAISEVTHSRRSYAQLSCVVRQCKDQMIFLFGIADIYF